MSRRADHLAEMRYALEHKCSLPEARDGLARLRWLAAQHRMADRQAGTSMPTPVGETPQYWWQRD